MTTASDNDVTMMQLARGARKREKTRDKLEMYGNLAVRSQHVDGVGEHLVVSGIPEDETPTQWMFCAVDPHEPLKGSFLQFFPFGNLVEREMGALATYWYPGRRIVVINTEQLPDGDHAIGTAFAAGCAE